MKYKCLIVDDEPIARDIVRAYINNLPLLANAGECKNAFEALEKTKIEDIDIMFLDINMPHLLGIALPRMIHKKPLIIFTTAYSDYAITSYELNAVDYLLKPFSFERFTAAVYKAVDILSKINDSTVVEAKNLSIKSEGKNHFVKPTDVVFAEAMKNYTKVYLSNGNKLFTLIPLSEFEKELMGKENFFVRVHRSFVISLLHITTVENKFVLMGQPKIPIGNKYKKSFLTRLGIK